MASLAYSEAAAKIIYAVGQVWLGYEFAELIGSFVYIHKSGKL